MQWMVWLEARTSAGEVTTTELVTFSRPGVVSTLAEIGLMLAETKTLLAKLQASMLCGQVAAYAAHYRVGSCQVPGWWCWRVSDVMAGARAATWLARGVFAIMAASDLVNLSGLMDDAKCFALVRQHRWPEGARCTGCGSASVIRDGCNDTQPHRQRYRCKACAGRFDDLTGTVLAGHHQPLRVWVLCLYFMGLNLSNRQIAGELGLAVPDVQAMTEQLRQGLVAEAPAVELKAQVEIDEVYVVAGHKGQPAAVAKRGGSDGAASWQARRAAARWRRTGHRSLA